MRIQIDGMHCDACVRRVRKALENAGVKPHLVEVGAAEIEAPELEAAVAAVRRAGYEPRKSE